MGPILRFVRSNIVGFIALFFALGGVAYALPGNNTVHSDDIVNGAVKSVDIRGSAVGPTDLAPSVRPRWAVVDAEGDLVRKRGATDAAKVGVGSYNVTFATPISNCGWTATLNGFSSSNDHPIGQLSVKPGGARVLNVLYSKSDGGEGEIPSTGGDRGFTVVVHC